MKTLIFTTLFVAFFAYTNAKIYSKCELVEELHNAGFPKEDLPDWVCLVEHESNYDSEAIGEENHDGSQDYGIFQINSKYWCNVGSPGGDCNLDCNSLISDDIGDDIQCAKMIFDRHHFDAWYGWINNCKGAELPSIDECNVK
ncbi:hypothetical protein PVAND_001250 [Polypedilum vanderplanki]|uniref:lysozyme n=1 Tax=Polypedilum vanderplanki TaxID=319348 RepID=A0A9J6BMT6_POLVA|nr:hypothetical protein PVAND_001250 [Polypedilum vanderplanki]